MPRVTIPGVGDVQFPNNLSRDEIMRQAEAMQAKASQPILDPKDLPTSELIKGGFARTVESLKGSAFDIMPALGASLFGNDKYAKGQMEEYKQRMADIEQQYPTAYQSYKDINSVGQAFDYGAENFGQLGPDVIAFMLGAGVGTTAGKVAAKKGLERAIEEHVASQNLPKAEAEVLLKRYKDRATEGVLQKQALEHGADVGLKTGLWGSSLALNVPDTFNQIYQETGTLNPGLALTIGPLVSALDVITPERFIRQISPAGKQIVANELLQKSELVPLTWKREFGKEVFKNAAAEGLTEGAQQALQNYGSELAGSKDKLFSQHSIDSILDASLRGALGGTLFGAPGAAFEANRSKQARQTAIDTQQRQEQIQANQQLLYPTQLAEQQGGAEPTATVGEPPIQGGPQTQFELPIPTAQVGEAPIQAGEQAQFGLNTQEQQLLNLLQQHQQQQDIQLKNKQATNENIRKGDLNSTPVQNTTVENIKAATTPEVTTPETTHILDADKLKAIGLKENAGIFRQLVDKDLSKEDDVASAIEILDRATQNRNFTPELKNALTNIIGEGIDYGQRLNAISKSDRTRDEVSNRPAESTVAEGVGESAGVSVDNTGRPIGTVTAGEKSQPGALTATVGQAPIQAGPQATFAAPTVTPAANAGEELTEAEKEGITKERQKPRKVLQEEIEGTQEWQQMYTIPAKPFNPHTAYSSFYGEDIANLDDQLKVRFELLQNEQKTDEGRAAKIYFGKMKRLVDNLINIGYDLAFDTPVFKPTTETTIEARFFEGLNGNNAKLASKWVYQNLSKESQTLFNEILSKYKRAASETSQKDFVKRMQEAIEGIRESRLDRDPTIIKYIEEQAKEVARAKEVKEKQRPFHYERIMGQKVKVFDIIKDAISELSQVLHPRIVQALQQGDLKLALSYLTANEDAFIAKTANRLSQIASDAKVRVEPNLVSIEGKKVPGYYDPRNNTIYLDADQGMNTHVLMHEVLHSVISHELDNPNSQLARHLQQIFDDVKDTLDTAYGAENVQEFAAEAWSNQSFRAKLQSINPQGRQYSAWDKFSRAITNFLRKLVGMPSKPLESALDEVDRIIDALISPAPQYRNSGALHAPSNAKSEKIFTGVDKIINATSYLNTNQKAALSEGIKQGSASVKSGVLGLLPMHALGEVADKDAFPGLGMKFNNTIHERDGYRNKLSRGIDAVVSEAKEAIKSRPDQHDAFNKLVNESTVNEVDPTKNESDYTSAEDIKKYKELKAEYIKLSPKWQKLYSTMRDAYKQMFEELKDAIRSRINETNLDDATKEKVKREIMDKLSKKGLIEPYFALGREGSYWLGYNFINKNGEADRAQEAFKTDYERKLRMQELEGLTGVSEIEPYSQISDINYRRAPSGSFVNSVLGIMETNNVDAKAIDEMMRLFVTMLPETAAAKAFLKRKNIEGYMEDTIGVFERKMRGMSHQIANMAYNPKLTSVVDEMREHTIKVGKGTEDTPARDNQLQKSYLQEFEKHLGYVLNPRPNDLGGILNSAAFAYTLGFNVSSAIVNAANIPMIVAPYLKGKYDNASVVNAIGNATKIFLGSGTSTEMEVLGAGGRKTKMKVMQSIANYASDSEIGKKYKTLIDVANRLGQLNRSQLYEVLSGDTRSTFLNKFNAASGWVMHHGERMNREITMIAAYDLEMQKLASDIKSGKITQEQAENTAANKAIYTAELTNGGISAAAAPRVSQHALGKMFFMYKRYGISMYYMMLKTAKEAFNKNLSPAERKAAWKQLGGIFGMSALMAGVGGVPFFGMLSMLYGMFNDDDDDDLDTVTRKYMGDFLYKGPTEYMTNLSIASRISLNDLIVRDTKAGSGASTFQDQVLQVLGGPVYGVGQRIARGYSKMNEGHFERGLEDILPSAISNALLKAPRYAIEGTTTLRGDPITGDVNAWNIGAQAFGFAPADYTKQLEINAREKGVDKFVSQQASKFRNKWNVARTVGDADGMDEARDKLIELGEKHPGLGINAGTITQDLEKSKKQFDRATKEMVNGVRYSKKMLKELQADATEYGDK